MRNPEIRQQKMSTPKTCRGPFAGKAWNAMTERNCDGAKTINIRPVVEGLLFHGRLTGAGPATGLRRRKVPPESGSRLRIQVGT